MAPRDNMNTSSPMWKVPATFTPLVGREREVAAISTFLSQTEKRFLTLIGVGGIGKTRLSLEVAQLLRSCFADGVCFVELAALRDPGLVVPTLATRLGIKEGGREPIVERLKGTLRDKRLLLLLDNFEHLLPAAPQVEELLAACPALHIIVTSRTPVRVRAEYLFPVAPLALPDLSRLPEPSVLAHTAAVALFVQRAQAIQPGFQLTSANARIIAEICVRLDGLPLAIELAAARVSVLSPPELLARLSSRLGLLTRGAWDLPERQQTLRKTIQWSYDLLSAEEQRLFRCLSVFVGGCTVDAAETVWTTLSDDQGAGQVLNGVASLTDKSLLQRTEQEGQESRLVMLETIREYGLEMLAACQELEATQRAHAAYYLALAEEAEGKIGGQEHAAWVKRLEREHDNLRTAMHWFLEQGKDREAALRMSAGLHVFWAIQDHFLEGRTFLEQALARSEGAAPPVRLKALIAAVAITLHAGDLSRCEAFCKECLSLCRTLEDKFGRGFSLFALGCIARYRENFAAARSLFEESLALAREMGYKEGMLWSLLFLAYLAYEQGDDRSVRLLCKECLTFSREGNIPQFAWPFFLSRLAQLHLFALGDAKTGRALLEESLAIFQERNDTLGKADYYRIAALVALQQGDVTTARACAETSVRLSREAGRRPWIARMLALLGKVMAASGDLTEAGALSQKSLATVQELDDQGRITFGVEGLASVAAAQGEVAWAVRLWGAAEALRYVLALSVLIPPFERAEYKRAVAAARAHLGEQAFAAAWAEGRTMTLEQVLAWREPPSLPEPVPSANPATSAITPPPAYPNDLTEREVQVLRLVAQGLTNTQIAERLVVSPHTVHAHLKTIHSKLGVTSRSAATRFAVEHHLV
jgi:predicted ATPase/DNA-binding CsgD family transcriptional regulator